MKKIIFVLFFLILTSPAYAVIYRWVDQKGALNFTDDYNKIPPDYRDDVEKVDVPKMRSPTLSQVVANPSGPNITKAPPIEQGLVREGFFAVKLVEALRMGSAKTEAEAESMLASVGIAPRNGWIADYPVTPDIIGELQNTVAQAADSGKLAMKKDDAMKAFEDLGAQQNLPVRADTGSPYAGMEQPDAAVEQPQNYGEYSNPEVINNYYYDQGPPVVTYYPPPPDYGYLYSWVPYPFWCSELWFSGFFILSDFHRVVHLHGRPVRITNHVIDPHANRISRIDPATRQIREHRSSGTGVSRGFASPEAKSGASSILQHSQQGPKPANITPRPRAVVAPHGAIGAPTFRGPSGPDRSLAAHPPAGRGQGRIIPRSIGTSSFIHSGGFGPTSGTTFARASAQVAGGGRGFHSGGFGSRGFSGGGGRGFSGGGGGDRR